MMKAIGAVRGLPVDHEEVLLAFETAVPEPSDGDLLIRVRAVGINPVDAKIRKSLGGGRRESPRILGWDAAGVVEAVGVDADGAFSVGDTVFYAGDLSRPGCNAEFHCVDWRLVARAPKSRGMVEAAALPLCSLTAWELLFERMGLVGATDAGGSLLVINGAGGVGSVLIPLARHAGLRVVATASRPETRAWCARLGAEAVISPHQPLRPQCEALGISEFPWIANLYDPAVHWEQTADLLAPFGTLGLIVEPSRALNLGDPLKAKCARIVWEFMAARAKYQTRDLASQGGILAKVAELHDAGILPPIHTRILEGLTVENFREAHAAMEGSTAHGKWVVSLGR